MMRVKDIALILIFVCIAQQFLQVDSRASNAKRGENKKGKRKEKQATTPKSTPPVRDRYESGWKGKSGAFKGRFSTTDKVRCTWVAAGGDTSVLVIHCKKGANNFHCENTAKPRSCPEYASSSKTYWRQIARSLKRMKQPCRDSKELVEANVCRNGPEDAHFKLNTAPKTQVQPQRGNKSCEDLADRRRLAEEYCGSSWSSLCTFIFAMVESDTC
ncbi:LOW QUALITY PROTEIN: fibroblast growth factor-binding protein 1 [Brachyhypopomus gauderio]|uniref:LOW QUALITY PROTEIN: fibroblast growth factor-binding protein 1 n=1 Tax=Brachyhypopomus gauderio TaxID=698409 RepID=UPI00404358F8